MEQTVGSYTAVCPLWRLISEFKMCFEMNSVTGESCITAVKLMRAQSLTYACTHTFSSQNHRWDYKKPLSHSTREPAQL